MPMRNGEDEMSDSNRIYTPPRSLNACVNCGDKAARNCEQCNAPICERCWLGGPLCENCMGKRRIKGGGRCF